MNPPASVRKHCPVFKGIPVPFFASWSEDGIPDFKCLNMTHVVYCAEHKVCGICAQPIMGAFVFIGGVEAMEHHYFRDPGMHEKCARWAGHVCPFLAGRKVEHSKAPKAEGVNTWNPDQNKDRKPGDDKYGLYFAHGFDAVKMKDGSTAFHAKDGGRVEWVYYDKH